MNSGALNMSSLLAHLLYIFKYFGSNEIALIKKNQLVNDRVNLKELLCF